MITHDELRSLLQGTRQSIPDIAKETGVSGRTIANIKAGLDCNTKTLRVLTGWAKREQRIQAIQKEAVQS